VPTPGINNNQQFYTQLYRSSDLQMRRAAWRNEIIYSSPRFGMEAVGIGIVALFAYIATLNLGGIDQFLPVLGAFVLGAQKLLPAIQKAYASSMIAALYFAAILIIPVFLFLLGVMIIYHDSVFTIQNLLRLVFAIIVLDAMRNNGIK